MTTLIEMRNPEKPLSELPYADMYIVCINGELLQAGPADDEGYRYVGDHLYSEEELARAMTFIAPVNISDFYEHGSKIAVVWGVDDA
jgi:hypothetical protein